MNPDIFRAFSIRGIADSELTDDITTKIGFGIGQFFNKRQGNSITIGRDVRVSSQRISQAVIRGLLQAGLKVIDVGMVPTPVLNFAADYYRTSGGVMITASHNPPHYNGLKIRSDVTLDKEDLQEIRSLAETCPDLADFHVRETAVNYQTLDPIPIYTTRLNDFINPNTQTFKIVVDGKNGTNGVLVSQVLQNAGHEVIQINCDPDGTFPNGEPDPTVPGATMALSAAVQEEMADVGFAYDGDGDRVVVVDEQGRTLAGDQTLMLLARDSLSSSAQTEAVVYEVLCTQAIADDISHHGGIPVMAASGYFYIQQAIQKHDAVLGGELSGHFFFREPGFRFDDSIVATLKILKLMNNTSGRLSQLVDQLPSYHSSPEIRLPCPDKIKSHIVELVEQAFTGKYHLDTIDGVRIHFPDGWALVRMSNTQPIISMRFEAQTASALEKIQDQIQNFVSGLIEQHERG